MFPEEKLNVVRNYLRNEFPGYDLHDRYDFDRVAHTFRLTSENKVHLVTVSREFLDDHNASEISSSLEKSQLGNCFQGENILRAIVTNHGIKLEEK